MKLSQLIAKLQAIHNSSWTDCDVVIENEKMNVVLEEITNITSIFSRPSYIPDNAQICKIVISQ